MTLLLNVERSLHDEENTPQIERLDIMYLKEAIWVIFLKEW
jgi:hypothetical protein